MVAEDGPTQGQKVRTEAPRPTAPIFPPRRRGLGRIVRGIGDRLGKLGKAIGERVKQVGQGRRVR